MNQGQNRESGAQGVLFDFKKTEGRKSRDTVPLNMPSNFGSTGLFFVPQIPNFAAAMISFFFFRRCAIW
jgi:hypothetical protein